MTKTKINVEQVEFECPKCGGSDTSLVEWYTDVPDGHINYVVCLCGTSYFAHYKNVLVEIEEQEK